MNQTRVYLDWNATTPLRPEARTAMLAAWDQSGNPSSIHAEGRSARRLMEEARTTVAEAVGAESRNVIFTSGGTESNALALAPGTRTSGSAPTERLLVSAIEHVSVLAGGRFAAGQVATIDVTPQGIIDLNDMCPRLANGPPALVSVMLANNETGALQPIAEIAKLVHASGGLLHVDAIQGLGRTAVAMNELDADLLTLSSHKVGGPKGVGAVVLREGVALPPMIRGGGQERNRRGGTENVVGIVGFGAAVDAATRSWPAETARMETLRSMLEAGLTASNNVTIFADRVERLPNTVLFSAPGLRAETAVIAFDLEGVAVSSGSACSSGKVTRSHVLTAMGIPGHLAEGAIRISLGWTTTEADIQRFLEAWTKVTGALPGRKQRIQA